MSKQLTLIAIDDGSGNIATCYTNDLTGLKVESASASCIVAKVLPSLMGGISENAWETNGKQFTVTPSSADSINTCSKDYQLSDANRVLVHNAIATLNVGTPVYIGATLPTEQFYNRGSDDIVNQSRINDKRTSLLKSCSNISGANTDPTILGCKIYPEAIPAYVYCSINADGSMNTDYPTEHTTLVIDLGRYTCDMAIISTGYSVIDYLTTEHGVQVLVDKFKVLLTQHSQELGIHDISAFSSTNLDQFIECQYIGSTLNTDAAIAARKDVSKLVQAAKEYLNDLIVADAKTLLKGDFNMLTRIVFVGGGANWLNELSQDWYHTVDIPAQPEMAVVRGTYQMLMGAEDAIYNELSMDKKDSSQMDITEA